VILSIVTVVAPSTKFSPVIVITSLPVTLPYLGSMESIFGVLAAEYVIVLRVYESVPIKSFAVHIVELAVSGFTIIPVNTTSPKRHPKLKFELHRYAEYSGLLPSAKFLVFHP